MIDFRMYSKNDLPYGGTLGLSSKGRNGGSYSKRYEIECVDYIFDQLYASIVNDHEIKVLIE